jgi:hypothetical protein
MCSCAVARLAPGAPPPPASRTGPWGKEAGCGAAAGLLCRIPHRMLCTCCPAGMVTSARAEQESGSGVRGTDGPVRCLGC